MNKKGIAIEQLLVLILVVAVVVMTLFALFNLGIIKKLDNLIPNFGFGEDNETGFEESDLYLETYNDERGCKPIEGEYRLKNGELERIYVNEWRNIEDKVANDNEFFNYKVKNVLTELENNIFMVSRNNEQIHILGKGFASTIEDGNTYYYLPEDKSIFLRNVEPNSVVTGLKYPKDDLTIEETEFYEKLIEDFDLALQNLELDFNGQIIEINYMIFEDGFNDDRGTKAVLFGNFNGDGYGIYRPLVNVNFQGYGDVLLYKIAGNPNVGVPLWRDADDEIAENQAYMFALKKEELIKEC